MIKKVKITFDRFKLMRTVILQAEKLTRIEQGAVRPPFKTTLQALQDAVSALNAHEALAVADQFRSGHMRRRETWNDTS